MRLSNDDPPERMRRMTSEQRRIAIEEANALMSEGHSREDAIDTAIAYVKGD